MYTDVDEYAPRLGLEFAAAKLPPTFRFTERFSKKSGYRFEIHPYGFTTITFRQLFEADDYAIGEVHAIDNEHAVARFAHGSGRVREVARRELHRWAPKDRWALRIERGIHSLTEPDPPVFGHWTPGICQSCRGYWGTGWATHMRYRSQGWQHTYCNSCDGRWRWWSRRKRDVPSD